MNKIKRENKKMAEVVKQTIPLINDYLYNYGWQADEYDAACEHYGVKSIPDMKPQQRMSEYRKNWYDRCNEVYNNILPFRK